MNSYQALIVTTLLTCVAQAGSITPPDIFCVGLACDYIPCLKDNDCPTFHTCSGFSMGLFGAGANPLLGGVGGPLGGGGLALLKGIGDPVRVSAGIIGAGGAAAAGAAAGILHALVPRMRSQSNERLSARYCRPTGLSQPHNVFTPGGYYAAADMQNIASYAVNSKPHDKISLPVPSTMKFPSPLDINAALQPSGAYYIEMKNMERNQQNRKNDDGRSRKDGLLILPKGVFVNYVTKEEGDVTNAASVSQSEWKEEILKTPTSTISNILKPSMQVYTELINALVSQYAIPSLEKSEKLQEVIHPNQQITISDKDKDSHGLLQTRRLYVKSAIEQSTAPFIFGPLLLFLPTLHTMIPRFISELSSDIETAPERIIDKVKHIKEKLPEIINNLQNRMPQYVEDVSPESLDQLPMLKDHLADILQQNMESIINKIPIVLETFKNNLLSEFTLPQIPIQKESLNISKIQQQKMSQDSSDSPIVWDSLLNLLLLDSLGSIPSESQTANIERSVPKAIHNNMHMAPSTDSPTRQNDTDDSINEYLSNKFLINDDFDNNINSLDMFKEIKRNFEIEKPTSLFQNLNALPSTTDSTGAPHTAIRIIDNHDVHLKTNNLLQPNFQHLELTPHLNLACKSPIVEAFGTLGTKIISLANTNPKENRSISNDLFELTFLKQTAEETGMEIETSPSIEFEDALYSITEFSTFRQIKTQEIFLVCPFPGIHTMQFLISVFSSRTNALQNFICPLTILCVENPRASPPNLTKFGIRFGRYQQPYLKPVVMEEQDILNANPYAANPNTSFRHSEVLGPDSASADNRNVKTAHTINATDSILSYKIR